MGAVKNYYHDEIIAAQDDQRADEFDCYEARLHSLLSELDWFVEDSLKSNGQSKPRILAAILRNMIQDTMKNG